MSLSDLIKPHIRRPGSLRTGQADGRNSSVSSGFVNSIKLASNENPLGASPKAVEAMREAASWEKSIVIPTGQASLSECKLASRLGCG